MVDIDISRTAMNDAAERATHEHRSLTDVIDALLRDYASGRTWLNLPASPAPGQDGEAAPGRTDLAEAAIQVVAGNMFRRYESEYSAAHLTWRDFTDDARADLEAAAPILADKIASAILRYADENEPAAGTARYLAWHRHFNAASAVAAKAFGRDNLEARSVPAGEETGDGR